MLAAVADAPPEVLEPALELLIKMYSAILDKPNEPKVRRIRWMNAKVQQHLANVPVAQDFLMASGFSILQSPVEESGTGDTEDVIIFQDGSSLTLLSEARGRLNRALAQSRSGQRLAPADTQERPVSMGVSDSAGDSPMAPASPSAAAPSEERPVSTHSAADFGAPGSNPSSAGVPSGEMPASWQAFANSDVPMDEPSEPASSSNVGPVRASAAESAAGVRAGSSGGAGQAQQLSDSELLQRMDALICSTRGADKDLLVPALELALRIGEGLGFRV